MQVMVNIDAGNDTQSLTADYMWVKIYNIIKK